MSKLVKVKDKKLFGVCGGIAKFVDIDPSIIRILFVLGTLFTGTLLFWVYIVLAIVLPYEE
jgi:phage shock protein PspC (stress-responsive transcriptional regulator)